MNSWRNTLPERILKGITGGFVLIGLVFSLWMTKYLPGFVPVYGQILYWYKALIAVTMTLLVVRQFLKRKSGQILLLLTGLLVYSLSLIFHALCLGHFEPAYTGWFEEWGTFILVMCFAVPMALRNSVDHGSYSPFRLCTRTSSAMRLISGNSPRFFSATSCISKKVECSSAVACFKCSSSWRRFAAAS